MVQRQILILIILIFLLSCKEAPKKLDQQAILKIQTSIQDGDIIFHTSRSGQSKAIQAATHSKYSHVGIIYKTGEKYLVYEAVQPVKLTPLKDWIERGESNHYVIKRLKNAKAVLTPQTLEKMKMVGNQFNGKDYDLYFGWSNDRIYCSELVWKIYKEGADIEIGTLQQLKDFDLRNKIVQEKLKERYGDKLPLNETVISPASMFDSNLLETITQE